MVYVTHFSSDTMKYEDTMIHSELQAMMRDSKMNQNYSRQPAMSHPLGGNMPHSAVSNGFSDTGGLGIPVTRSHGSANAGSTVGGSLSHMPPMSGNLPLPSVGGAQGLLQNIGLMNSSLDDLSGGVTLPGTSIPFAQNSVMGSHDLSSDGGLPDLKMAGLETSLGYNFGSSQLQSMSQQDITSAVGGAMMHAQAHHPSQGATDISALQGYMNVQKKPLAQVMPETPKMSMGNAASLAKAKVTPKNLSSWSSLAQSSANPANPSPSIKSANDSFAQFRKAAKEKEARVSVDVVVDRYSLSIYVFALPDLGLACRST